MNNVDFDFKRIAQGYKNRPFLHKQVICRFQKDITDKIFFNGLDVGCGAGLSAKALKRICKRVVGVDLSSEMIMSAREACKAEDGYEFIVSKAEEIPAAKDRYDIVTAAGVTPWLEQEAFLNNLKNIMHSEGYVLIYDFWISDKMKGNKAYTTWWYNDYLRVFPKPFRKEHVWMDYEVAPYGFSMLDQAQYEMEHEFDRESFIDFMMIQSNVNAKIEGDGRTIEEVREWFEKTLTPVFDEGRKTLIFTGYSWYMKLLL